MGSALSAKTKRPPFTAVVSSSTPVTVIAVGAMLTWLLLPYSRKAAPPREMVTPDKSTMLAFVRVKSDPITTVRVPSLNVQDLAVPNVLGVAKKESQLVLNALRQGRYTGL